MEYSLKAVKVVGKLIGEAHPHTVIAYGNLADIYAKMAEMEKAIPYYLK